MNAPSLSTHLANRYSRWFEPVPALGDLALMDHLFNRLDGAYPHKWRSAFPNEQAIDNWKVSWCEAFDAEGIEPQDIKAGLKACRSQYDWPPSCAEFIKACRPSVDRMVAYYEAVIGLQVREKGEMGTWSHPAIFWAASRMAFDLKNQTFSQVKDRWNKALSDEMDKGEWTSVPMPMLALPEPGKSQLSREQAAQALNDLGASDVLKPKTDHRLWAKRIVAGAKKPGHTYSALQIRFATMALSEQSA